MKDLGHAAHYFAEVITQDLAQKIERLHRTVDELRSDVERLRAAAQGSGDRFLNQKETAAFLGVSVEYIRSRRKDGAFPAPMTMGRSQRWARSVLVEWAQGNSRD